MQRELTNVCSGLSAMAINNNMIYVGSTSGDIIRIVDETPDIIANTGGVVSSLCFSQDGALFCGDLIHHAVLYLESDSDLIEFVKDHEGSPLRGPTGLYFDALGDLYFVDGGPFGSTSLASPKGMLMSVSDQLLEDLSGECMAYPSAITMDKKEKVIFVTETCTNRLLKFVQHPQGVWHASIFHQFAGGFGPTAVCMTERHIIVGRSDLSTEGIGRVSFLTHDGSLLRSVDLPEGNWISDIAVMNRRLYIAERTTGNIYSMSI
ncbi:hypothetical protein PCE1_004688 [Barthelona sp. PCE]